MGTSVRFWDARGSIEQFLNRLGLLVFLLSFVFLSVDAWKYVHKLNGFSHIIHELDQRMQFYCFVRPSLRFSVLFKVTSLRSKCVESQIAGTIAKSMTLLEEPLSRILSNRLSFLLSTECLCVIKMHCYALMTTKIVYIILYSLVLHIYKFCILTSKINYY